MVARLVSEVEDGAAQVEANDVRPTVGLRALTPKARSPDDAGLAARRHLRAICPQAPTLDRLIAHAERHSSDCVYETAESYLHPYRLLKLERELDRIDRGRCRRFEGPPGAGA